MLKRVLLWFLAAYGLPWTTERPLFSTQEPGSVSWLIFATADNGASGEGGLAGTFNETYVINGMQTPFEPNMRQYDRWGDPTTYPHYHAGWAMAGNTPFRYFKQSEHRGGQHDALVVHWPNGIKGKGEIRHQCHHIADIAPTILEAAKLKVPETYHGIKQMPMDGISMLYSFIGLSLSTIHSLTCHF